MNRVSKRNPCPICGKSGWCGVSDDGSLAICMRVPEGSISISKNDGFVHVLSERPRLERRTIKTHVEIEKPIKIESMLSNENMNGLFRLAVAFHFGNEYADFAQQLGLTVDSLDRLQVGWCRCLEVWSFPMFTPDGQIIGFRLRTPTGKKYSMTGGKEGLFIPRELQFDQRRLLICEGPTDTAACLDLGMDAIGRPSCLGAVKMTVAFVRQNWPLDVVVVADSDVPGQRGAAVLASALLGVARTVRIIEPPAGIKDVRQWKQQGAIRADVLTQVEKVKPLQLFIGRSV
jgi:hypothetical protein